ncbi:MAG: hypothetical protein N4A70_09335 [Pelagimonas sp.]|nr:hypothetical protein [Pelagimonas sp.]
MDEVTDVKLLFRRSQMVKACADGAFVYKCSYSLLRGGGLPAAHGNWRRRGDKFELALYHHTNAKAAQSILASRGLWSSQWNIQGTQKLSNISYVYFTSLPAIANENDLRRVAMSPNGFAHFLPTNAPSQAKHVVALDVYKRTCNGVDTPMKFWVNAELISPNHLWFHRPRIGMAHYEIVLPRVFRVGLEKERSLSIKGQMILTAPSACKSFNSVIVGDAATSRGLTAPFREEETKQIGKIDAIPSPGEIVSRWSEKQNSRVFDEIGSDIGKVAP